MLKRLRFTPNFLRASWIALAATAIACGCSSGGGGPVTPPFMTPTNAPVSAPTTTPVMTTTPTPVMTTTPTPVMTTTPTVSPTTTAIASSAPTTTPSAAAPTTTPPSITPTTTPVPIGTQKPATPNPLPTTTPTPTTAPMALNPQVYDPPADTSPYFQNSVFHNVVTSDIGIDPNSASWLIAMKNGEGSTPFGEFQFAADSSGLQNDYMQPIYEYNTTNVPYVVHCTANYGTTQNPYCALEGKTVYLPQNASPQASTPTSCNGDCHIGIVDQTGNREIDLFGVSWPPTPGHLTVIWAGVCALSNTGYDSCASTATSNALSQGAIRPSDLLMAVGQDSYLPEALAVATSCNFGLAAPFSGSDGHCIGGPPEGAHVYLAESLAQIDAYNVPAISKVIMKTLAVYGGYITDTSGGSPGFSLSAESARTYTALGLPNPWTTQVVPEIKAEGWDSGIYGGTYHEVPPYPAQMFKDLHFASVGGYMPGSIRRHK